MEIFTCRWDEIALHPFALQAKHHNDIGPVQCGIEIAKGNGTKALNPAWHEGRGCNHAHLCAQRFEAKQIGSCHPAVQNVAANDDGLTFNLALAAHDGQRIEQALSRVLVAAVTGVQHGTVDFAGNELHGAGTAMANHNGVRAHGVQRHCRVDKGFALFHARLRRMHIDNVRAEPLSSDFER